MVCALLCAGMAAEAGCAHPLRGLPGEQLYQVETLKPQMAKVRLGDKEVEEVIRPIMEDSKIFGVDLYEAGLAGKVCGYFKEFIAGPGAVRKTLEKYV